jgi:hypothetical protein
MKLKKLKLENIKGEKIYFPNLWFVKLKEPEYSNKLGSPFLDFWTNFIDQLQNGFHIADGEVYIHGWLLWHTVVWSIERDIILPNGKSFKAPGKPSFRDNEWELAQNLIRCEQENKGFLWIGARGFGKTVCLSSISSYYYTTYHNIEVLLTAGNAADINMIATKCDYGLSALDSRTLKKARVENDLRKEVRAQYKDVEGNRHGSNSRIIMRNFADGENTMAANGTRPKVHIFDEIGKTLKLKQCYNDSKMCWMNDYGQFAIPILAGTGGDMDKGKDSEEMFYDPAPYNLLEFVDIYENLKKPISYFTPVTKARNDYKEEWTLYDYLVKKQGRTDLKPHPDLLSIKIMVSNEERCLEEYVKPRRAQAEQSDDKTVLTKEVAYNPIVPSEAFTVIGNNKFPIEALKKWKDYLFDNDIRGISVKLERNPDGLVFHTPSDASPIRDYPIKTSTLKRGAIIIYEFPDREAPPNTYIGGADPYNQHQAETSQSLGSLYIYKRMTTLTGSYSRQIVAEYVGRPETMNDWHNNVELLLDWYDAVLLPENEGSTLTQHFDQQNKAWRLADVFNFQREINPTTQVNRSKGLPATTKIIEFCMNLLYDYVNEKIIIGYIRNSDTGMDEPVIKMGYTRILDPMLLQEMIEYGDKNADRIVAFRHVLAYEKSLEKFGTEEEEEKDSYEPIVSGIRTPFIIRTKQSSSSQSGRNGPFYSKRW